MFKYFVATLAVFISVTAGPADIVKKCSSNDTKCMKEAAAGAIPFFAKGIPELGVEPMDPLFIKKIDASTPSLKLILTDINAVGLSSCKPKKIQRDNSKSQLYVRLICDIDANANYDMKGQLLVLPIEGKDKVHLKIKNILVKADLDMDKKTGPDGKVYWVVKDWRYSYELKDKADLFFANLFENSEVLRSATEEVVANHSNEIIYEVGGPIIDYLADLIIKNIKVYLSKVPYDNFALD